MPGKLLRVSTAGNVDDGKSTLIGRLLFDSELLLENEIEALRARDRAEVTPIDLARVTDGLRAEREQGITIDVAYRYFTTKRRRFIVADSPGHVELTRNMMTGASMADVAVVLLDAVRGTSEQTLRHARLASLLGVPYLVVCVNKMDLVDFSKAAFDQRVGEFCERAEALHFRRVTFIPVSALHGDNVVDKSARTPWYDGPPLLAYLETLEADGEGLGELRLPIQHLVRAEGFHAYAGRVAAGKLSVGDEIIALPSGKRSRVARIAVHHRDLGEAVAGMSIAVQLEETLDMGRGEMLVHPETPARVSSALDATLCWLDSEEMKAESEYVLKLATRSTTCRVSAVGRVFENDIAQVLIKTTAPIAFDPYYRSRITGGFILIDATTHQTVAAGMALPGVR